MSHGPQGVATMERRACEAAANRDHVVGAACFAAHAGDSLHAGSRAFLHRSSFTPTSMCFGVAGAILLIFALATLARRFRRRPRASVSSCEGATSLQTFGNAFNGVVGSGLFGIPYAVAVLGLDQGLVMIVGFGALSGYTALQLSGLTSKPSSEGYVELAERAFGIWGRRFTSSVLYTELLGVTGIFLVLAGRSFVALDLVRLTPRGQVLFAAGVACPFLVVRDFTALSRLSFVGVAALAVCIAAVLSDALCSAERIDVAGLEFETGISERLAAIGTIIFSYACHVLIPELRASMAQPDEFPAVIFATFAAAACLNACFGIAAAWGYGVANTPEFVLEAMTAGIMRQICLTMVMVNTVLKIPLPIFAAAMVLERSGVHFLVARLAVLLAGVLLAVGIPGFARLMGLVGLITASTLVFILPPVLELKLCGGTPQRRAINAFVIATGVGFAASGEFANDLSTRSFWRSRPIDVVVVEARLEPRPGHCQDWPSGISDRHCGATRQFRQALTTMKTAIHPSLGPQLKCFLGERITLISTCRCAPHRCGMCGTGRVQGCMLLFPHEHEQV